MTQEMKGQWTDAQEKYIRFLSRGCKDKFGREFTEDEFGKIIGVAFVTLWRWKKLPGFKQAVFEEILENNMRYLPDLMKAQTAAGLKKGKGGETAATQLILRQYELLKSDRIDHTTNGKEMVIPILGGATAQPDDKK